MDDVRPRLRRHRGKDARCDMVQKVRHGQVLLRLVHIRVGRAVDDDIDLLRLADEPHRIAVGDVQIDRVHPGKGSDVRENVPVGGPGGDVAHLRPELSVGAANQYVHKWVCLYSSVHSAWAEQENRNRLPVQGSGFPAYISPNPGISGASFPAVSFFSSFARYWPLMARYRWQSDPIMQ